MPPNPLSQAHLQIIAKASSDSIVVATNRIKASVAAGAWIDPGNAYANDCVTVIKQHVDTQAFMNTDLQDYVAASTALHCLDGWAFLGRALDSHVKGDTYSALHLAYYAELRGAIAILAMAGIGVFNRIHLVFDTNGMIEPIIGRTTHDFTWLALTNWISRIGTGTRVTDSIRVDQYTITDWLQSFGFGYVNQSVARDWLTKWSVDIAQLSNDHETRNVASYRPTEIQGRRRLDSYRSSIFLRELWYTLEPQPFRSFPVLDKCLLRLALESAFQLATGDAPTAQPAAFRTRIENAVSSLGYAGFVAEDWKAFLTRVDHRGLDPLLLQDAGASRVLGSADQHLELIARATLLLRLASGLVSTQLLAAAYTPAELQDWVKREADDLGFRSPGENFTQTADLWDDVAVMLEDLEIWESAGGAPRSPRYEWFGAVSSALLGLGGAERFALWGLA